MYPTVVEKVKAGVIISLPGGKSKVSIASNKADEPELTINPYLLSNNLEIFFSKILTFLPI